MQSIFAKNGSETPEPVKAQVKGESFLFQVDLIKEGEKKHFLMFFVVLEDD